MQKQKWKGSTRGERKKETDRTQCRPDLNPYLSSLSAKAKFAQALTTTPKLIEVLY